MTFTDFLMYAMVFGSILFFGSAAVLAMAWAFRNGQFENFSRGSRSIFDADEPIGEMTDRFPPSARDRRAASE